MKLHIFFSVHEQLFAPVATALRTQGISNISGFVWGNDQRLFLERSGFEIAPLTVFTRDILDQLDATPADVDYLAAWEQRCGIPLQHMIFAERHFLRWLSYEQVLRVAELIFRRVERDFDDIRPDAYFSEDVSCLTSFIHYAVARDRGVRIVLINHARFPRRVTTYANPFQLWDRLDAIFPNTPPGTLTDEDYAAADSYITSSRNRPIPLSGLTFRSRLRAFSKFDLDRLTLVARRWRDDDRNPTLRSPAAIVAQRGRRLLRAYLADSRKLFEAPPPGEKYVLYPLHFQPEATTLVLAPYYLNQLAMIEDIAKSLPAGYRLYVKEHKLSRGRWPLSFYADIKRIPGVRLLSPEEDAATLIRNAAAVAVITGTMGWEALLYERPAITFGHVFYNTHPFVHRAGELPKQDWPALFRRAIFEPRRDPELLRHYVACAYHATSPGMTGNPTSFPSLLEPANVQALVAVVGDALGLTETGSRTRSTSTRSA